MIDEILNDTSASILLIEERDNKKVVIAAPHHTPGGQKYMPCSEHPDGDENTGILARKIAVALGANSIIACNYKIDPNKNLRTDYSMQVSQWTPKYLVEIHGHGAKGGKRPDNNTIEISSGSKERNSNSIAFAEALNKLLCKDTLFSNCKAIGDFEKIYFKASSTATIIDERWISIHIELPPSLRLNESNSKIPDSCDKFCDYLVQVIKQIVI